MDLISQKPVFMGALYVIFLNRRLTADEPGQIQAVAHQGSDTLDEPENQGCIHQQIQNDFRARRMFPVSRRQNAPAKMPLGDRMKIGICRLHRYKSTINLCHTHPDNSLLSLRTDLTQSPDTFPAE